MERKTAKEYRKEKNGLEKQIKALNMRITERLIELSQQNPEAPITKQANLEGTIIKAKSINKNYVHPDIDLQLHFIENIEKYLEEQQPYKQLKIEGF